MDPEDRQSGGRKEVTYSFRFTLHSFNFLSHVVEKPIAFHRPQTDLLYTGRETRSVCQAAQQPLLCVQGTRLLWPCSKDPVPTTTTTTVFFIHVAAGTSRLINSEPTGESAAAQICIHLSEPRARMQRGREGRTQLSSHARNGDTVDGG